MFNESVPVRASIHTLGGLSAHAGQDALMGWLAGAQRKPKMTYVVHGEPEASQMLSARIARELKWPTTVAAPDTPYDV